jgi:hypothetical protein
MAGACDGIPGARETAQSAAVAPRRIAYMIFTGLQTADKKDRTND